MAEGMISRKFETEERFSEPTTEYLRKHGVKKLGYHEAFEVRESEESIEVCAREVTRYYYDDKEPEELPMGGVRVPFPKRFLPQMKALIEKIIEAKK